jgi:hypothetical protein
LNQESFTNITIVEGVEGMLETLPVPPKFKYVYPMVKNEKMKGSH